MLPLINAQVRNGRVPYSLIFIPSNKNALHHLFGRFKRDSFQSKDDFSVEFQNTDNSFKLVRNISIIYVIPYLLYIIYT